MGSLLAAGTMVVGAFSVALGVVHIWIPMLLAAGFGELALWHVVLAVAVDRA